MHSAAIAAVAKRFAENENASELSIDEDAMQCDDALLIECDSASTPSMKTGWWHGCFIRFFSGATQMAFACAGLVYDSAMSKHICGCNNNKNHVEHGGRVHSIWARLCERGLADR